MTDADWVWMNHPDVADPARLPARAADAWRARGWRECPAPPEPNPVLGELHPLLLAAQQRSGADTPTRPVPRTADRPATATPTTAVPPPTEGAAPTSDAIEE